MKKFRKDRNITIVLLFIVLVGYILKNMIPIFSDRILYSGILLLLLIIVAFFGLVLPLLNQQGFKEFDGWMLGALVLLVILGVMVILQMIFGMYSEAFYGYGFDAISVIALCLAIWQNHIDFIKTNKHRMPDGTGSAVLWTGASITVVKGLMFAYRDKKKKK